jgi:hypothetical protein
MNKARRNEKRARTALGIILGHSEELLGRSIENDDELLETAQILVADICHLFKREQLKNPVTEVVVAGVKKFREEE